MPSTIPLLLIRFCLTNIKFCRCSTSEECFWSVIWVSSLQSDESDHEEWVNAIFCSTYNPKVENLNCGAFSCRWYWTENEDKTLELSLLLSIVSWINIFLSNDPRLAIYLRVVTFATGKQTQPIEFHRLTIPFPFVLPEKIYFQI